MTTNEPNDNASRLIELELDSHSRFVELIDATVSSLNHAAALSADEYSRLSPSAVEEKVLDHLRIQCEKLGLDKHCATLVSGKRFPDIKIGKCYGIEVKSTQSDKWTSIGSSILETTRIDDVTDVYLMFAKLGGDTPQFACRRYQDILSEITLTHYPRYLIDMNLKDGESIFKKMGVDYDSFRVDPDNVQIVRKHYHRKAVESGREIMPWWYSGDVNSTTDGIKLFSKLPVGERRRLAAIGLILFNEIYDQRSSHTKYDRFSQWLVSYANVVNPNIRDCFTSGGRITKIGSVELSAPIAKIYANVIDLYPVIKSILEAPTKEMLQLIEVHNPRLLEGGAVLDNWIGDFEATAAKYNVEIAPLIKEAAKCADAEKGCS